MNQRFFLFLVFYTTISGSLIAEIVFPGKYTTIPYLLRIDNANIPDVEFSSGEIRAETAKSLYSCI